MKCSVEADKASVCCALYLNRRSPETATGKWNDKNIYVWIIISFNREKYLNWIMFWRDYAGAAWNWIGDRVSLLFIMLIWSIAWALDERRWLAALSIGECLHITFFDLLLAVKDELCVWFQIDSCIFYSGILWRFGVLECVCPLRLFCWRCIYLSVDITYYYHLVRICRLNDEVIQGIFEMFLFCWIWSDCLLNVWKYLDEYHAGCIMIGAVQRSSLVFNLSISI